MSEQETNPPKSSGSLGLLKGIVLIGVLVVVELVGASMLIPSATETELLARELAHAAKGEEATEEETASLTEAEPDEETREVDLGAYNITRFDPEADKTLNVEFVIFGVVLASEEGDFNSAYGKSASRIKEQVVLTMHNAKVSDLSSAGLGLIKRQILEKTNRSLGRPLLREVVFTKINFVER